jgi:hypothetical protein
MTRCVLCTCQVGVVGNIISIRDDSHRRSKKRSPLRIVRVTRSQTRQSRIAIIILTVRCIIRISSTEECPPRAILSLSPLSSIMFRFTGLTFLLLAAASSASSVEEGVGTIELLSKFRSWVEKHDKTYHSHAEEMKRLKIWSDNHGTLLFAGGRHGCHGAYSEERRPCRRSC